MLQNAPNIVKGAKNAMPSSEDHSLHKTFLAAWRERRTVLLICTAMIVLASIFVLIRSPKYTARAIVEISTSIEDSQNDKSQLVMLSPTAATDAASVLGSEALANNVVMRLGLDRLEEYSWFETFVTRWRESRINALIPLQIAIPTHVDAATKRLMQRLVVRNEPRSNIVTVDFISRNSDDAARIANAVVAEYVDNRRTQRLAARVETARAELTNLRLVFGPQHPNIAHAKETLDRAEVALTEEQSRNPPNETDLAALGYVVPARANTIPIGMGALNILGMALVLGLGLGVLYAQVAPQICKFWAEHKEASRSKSADPKSPQTKSTT